MAGKVGQKSKKPADAPGKYNQGFLEQLDGRVATVKRLREKLDLLFDDLGGETQASHKEKILAKRLVHVERLCERKEQVLVEGGEIREGDYLANVEALRRLCVTLGLRRRAKLIGNGTLAELLSQREAAS